MTYLMSAFEAEARALIDAYKLKKESSVSFSLFRNEGTVLILSGMGQDNARKACRYLLSNFDIKREDIFVNLGICAAKETYPIGTLLQIKTLSNALDSFILPIYGHTIPPVSCYSADMPLNEPSTSDISEMEAMGVYENIKDVFAPGHISFLKIASDHFSTAIPKKQFVISLVQNRIKEIKAHITSLQGSANEN